MDGRQANLSPAQREIMEIIWSRGELSATELRDALAASRDVARETVRTTLARMEQKGFVKHRTVGRTFLYSAVAPRATNLGQRVIDIIDSLCDGSAEVMMSALIDHRGLTQAEAERISAMIEETLAEDAHQEDQREDAQSKEDQR